MDEKEIIKEVLEISDKDLAVLLVNNYYGAKGMKEDMVSCLNMLDELAQGTGKKSLKNQIRKKILDNFNELPRGALRLNKEVVKILKEE